MSALSPGSMVTPESSDVRNAVRRKVITGDAQPVGVDLAIDSA